MKPRFRYSRLSGVFLLLCFMGTLMSIFCAYPCEAFQDMKNGREVQMAVKNEYVGDDSLAGVTMILINRSGDKRVRDFDRYMKNYSGLKKILIRIKTPPDIRLTGFLSWENPTGPDTQFLYLPAMKKTRRISSKDTDQSFVGSDFNLYDLGNLKLDDFDYSDTKTEMLDGRECWYYECTAKPGSDAPYSRIQTWTDKEYIIRTKMIYYDKRGRLFKQMTASKMMRDQNIWTPHFIMMENLQDRHKTEFHMKKIDYNVSVPDFIFDATNLETGKDLDR